MRFEARNRLDCFGSLGSRTKEGADGLRDVGFELSVTGFSGDEAVC